MAVRTELIDGAEVRVETGKGIVQYADLEGQGRNIRVELKATHANLTKPVAGWLDTTNNALFTAVREATERGVEVEYVIHVKRKRNVSDAIPFAELRNDQKVRDLVSISPAAGHRSLEEPSPASPASQNGSRRAPEPPTESWAPPPTDGPAIPEQGPPPARGVRRGVRVEEAKPWERHNGDGSVNLGSYEAQAVIGTAALAYKLTLEKNRVDAALTAAEVKAPTKAQVRNLGACLLQAADAAQAAVRKDGCADRMDSSHTRARGAIREAIDAYPVPWGATADQRREWQTTIAATAAMLLSAGVELLETPYGSLEDVRAGEETPAPPPASPDDRPDPPQDELVPRNTEEADIVEEAEARGADPREALAQARAALQRAKAPRAERLPA